MSSYIALALVLLGILGAACYRPPKRRPDWRHLTNEDRLQIYEIARFAALGSADLEANIRREAAGREARDYLLARCQARRVFSYRITIP